MKNCNDDCKKCRYLKKRGCPYTLKEFFVKKHEYLEYLIHFFYYTGSYDEYWEGDIPALDDEYSFKLGTVSEFLDFMSEYECVWDVRVSECRIFKITDHSIKIVYCDFED